MSEEKKKERPEPVKKTGKVIIPKKQNTEKAPEKKAEGASNRDKFKVNVKTKVGSKSSGFKRHGAVYNYDKNKVTETPGTAVFDIDADGIHYKGIPFGPELAKILMQELPAEAAARNMDIEWVPEVQRILSSHGSDNQARDISALKESQYNWDKDKEGKFQLKKDKVNWNIDSSKDIDFGTGEHANTRKDMLLRALNTGDWTEYFRPAGADLADIGLGEADVPRLSKRGHPYYDFNQWDGYDEAPALGSYADLLRISSNPQYAEARAVKQGKEAFYQGINKRHAKNLAEGKLSNDEYGKFDDPETQKARDLSSGRQAAMNQQYKNFLKWAAKEMGVEHWQDLKNDFNIELFDKVYDFDELTGKGHFDRNELIDYLKEKYANRTNGGTVSDERMKNIVSGLTEPFQLGY